jgi:hypothetical protein
VEKTYFFSRRIWSPRVRRFFVGLKTHQRASYCASADFDGYPSASMGPNRRAQERERAAARAATEAKRAEAERKALADAQKIVAIWNARQAPGREPWFNLLQQQRRWPRL